MGQFDEIEDLVTTDGFPGFTGAPPQQQMRQVEQQPANKGGPSRDAIWLHGKNTDPTTPHTIEEKATGEDSSTSEGSEMLETSYMVAVIVFGVATLATGVKAFSGGRNASSSSPDGAPPVTGKWRAACIISLLLLGTAIYLYLREKKKNSSSGSGTAGDATSEAVKARSVLGRGGARKRQMLQPQQPQQQQQQKQQQEQQLQYLARSNALQQQQQQQQMVQQEQQGGMPPPSFDTRSNQEIYEDYMRRLNGESTATVLPSQPFMPMAARFKDGLGSIDDPERVFGIGDQPGGNYTSKWHRTEPRRLQAGAQQMHLQDPSPGAVSPPMQMHPLMEQYYAQHSNLSAYPQQSMQQLQQQQQHQQPMQPMQPMQQPMSNNMNEMQLGSMPPQHNMGSFPPMKLPEPIKVGGPGDKITAAEVQRLMNEREALSRELGVTIDQPEPGQGNAALAQQQQQPMMQQQQQPMMQQQQQPMMQQQQQPMMHPQQRQMLQQISQQAPDAPISPPQNASQQQASDNEFMQSFSQGVSIMAPKRYSAQPESAPIGSDYMKSMLEPEEEREGF